jgi:hypothetical protein
VLLNAVKSGQAELLQYLYDYVGIRSIEDIAVVELAICHASQTNSLKLLETLLKFEFKVSVKHIQPYSETTLYRYSLFLSMCQAAKLGYLEVIQFVVEVLKVDFATKDPMSTAACYAEMLKYAAEEAQEDVLVYLLEEVGLEPALLPSQQVDCDCLLLIILNSPADDLAKQRMLQAALPLETPENFARVLAQTSDHQRLLLGRVKNRSQVCNGNGPHKHPKGHQIALPNC